MDRTQFITHIKATYQRCLQVLADKNADYGKEQDPWANFKFAAIANIGVEDAIMVRILDKMARISNLLHKEAVVKDEKIQDTIEDAINYLAILLAWIDDVNIMKRLKTKPTLLVPPGNIEEIEKSWVRSSMEHPIVPDPTYKFLEKKDEGRTDKA